MLRWRSPARDVCLWRGDEQYRRLAGMRVRAVRCGSELQWRWTPVGAVRMLAGVCEPRHRLIRVYWYRWHVSDVCAGLRVQRRIRAYGALRVRPWRRVCGGEFLVVAVRSVPGGFLLSRRSCTRGRLSMRGWLLMSRERHFTNGLRRVRGRDVLRRARRGRCSVSQWALWCGADARRCCVLGCVHVLCGALLPCWINFSEQLLAVCCRLVVCRREQLRGHVCGGAV